MNRPTPQKISSRSVPNLQGDHCVMRYRQEQLTKEALRNLVKRCPRLAKMCYWAGTSSIAIEELRHRQSFDLDFHTRKALQDVRPILAEIQASFPGKFEVVRSPDEFGSGFQGVLKLAKGKAITIEVLSNYEDVAPGELTASRILPGLKRVSLTRYLTDKIQCVAERAEARDLVDIHAVLQKRRDLQLFAKNLLAQQDALLLTERLLGWTDSDIKKDLKAYADVDPGDAVKTRDLLLQWLKSASLPKRAR